MKNYRISFYRALKNPKFLNEKRESQQKIKKNHQLFLHLFYKNENDEQFFPKS